MILISLFLCLCLFLCQSECYLFFPFLSRNLSLLFTSSLYLPHPLPLFLYPVSFLPSYGPMSLSLSLFVHCFPVYLFANLFLNACPSPPALPISLSIYLSISVCLCLTYSLLHTLFLLCIVYFSHCISFPWRPSLCVWVS